MRSISNVSAYPLTVGNKWELTETVKLTQLMTGVKDSDIQENTLTYEVEQLEELVVTAGTLDCFKVVTRNQAGDIVLTTWVSNETKYRDVKVVESDGTVTEMVSYSFSH